MDSVLNFLNKFDKASIDTQISVEQSKEFYRSISNECFVKNVTEVVIQVRDSIHQMKGQH